MNKPKWTPGPWELGEHDRNGQRIVKAEQGIELFTCWHHCVGSIEKEMEANARLIAHAPDLFDALESIADDVCGLLCPSVWKTAEGRPPCHPKCQAVRAALTKARGGQL